MSSTIGERLRVTLFGQSHGEAVGVVVDGLPGGEAIDKAQLQTFLDRRSPGHQPHSSARREADVPRFLSGLVEGRTCGAPLCAVIENQDVDSSAYAEVKWLPRPGHADYPARVKLGADVDLRGGGHFSGRLTAPLCVAGGIALQLLARRGIGVGAHIASIGGVEDAAFDPVRLEREALLTPGRRAFPVVEEAAGHRMEALIEAVAAQADSVGGIIECGAVGLPVGLGSPPFGGVENRLSAMLYGIPGIRGVSFGNGFDAAALRGSAQNDAYAMEDGRVFTETNRHGGVLGGLTTGMPLLLRVAVKPTPSIGQPQRTVDLRRNAPAELRVTGRHDPCIVPRAVPCVEAAVAITLLDLLLQEGEAHDP